MKIIKDQNTTIRLEDITEEHYVVAFHNSTPYILTQRSGGFYWKGLYSESTMYNHPTIQDAILMPPKEGFELDIEVFETLHEAFFYIASIFKKTYDEYNEAN